MFRLFMRSFFALSIMITAVGCTPRSVANPNFKYDKERAKKIIQVSLEEQQGGYNLSNIIVSDDRFSAEKTGTKRSIVAGGVAAVQSTHVVYYDRISEFTFRIKSSCIVVIYGEGHRRLLNLEFPNEKMAREFINAVHSMRSNI